jgi:ATP-dependent RNA helicase RhlE
MQFSSFTLDDRLQQAIQAAGYVETTPIQESAIPAALEGRDLIGTAMTGTGKTAAFVLPLLQHLLTHEPVKRGSTRALIVTPTRELAEQVHAAVKQLGQFTRIRSATVYGGVGFAPQEKALLKGTEIIVACPGRLLDHLGRRNADLRGVEILVLDEADRMLDMGFLPDVRRIVDQTPRERQTMFFGATFAPELDRLAREILRDPKRVQEGISAPASTVEHTLCPVSQERKTEILLRLLDETDTRSVLVFTRTKHRADRVAAQIERAGYRTATLHSNKSQGARQKALDGFRSGEYQLLVATDIAARGLDIASISHVINYDVPDCADAYIHRIGRTGRAERTGDAFTLVTADDHATLRDIERALGEPITVRKVEGFDYGMPSLDGGGRGGRLPATPTSFNSRSSGPSRAGGWPSPKGGGRRPFARGRTR